MTDINKEIEEIEEDAPANSMGSGQVASHNNFPLGKPMNVTDRRYKKNGKTVMLKKFKSWSESVELSEDNVSIIRDIVKNKQFKTIKLKDGKAAIDLFTASAIVNAIDKRLNKNNVEKVTNMLNNGTKSQLMKLVQVVMK